MSESLPQRLPGSEILFYQTEDGKSRIEVRLEGETLWLSQADLTQLYQTTKQNISLHIQNIYEEDELSEAATVKEYLTVQSEGDRQVSRQVKFYNLDSRLRGNDKVKRILNRRARSFAALRMTKGALRMTFSDLSDISDQHGPGTDKMDRPPRPSATPP